MHRSPPLFQKHDWSAVADAQHHGMRQEILGLSTSQILSVSTDDLCDHFTAKYHVDLPVLLEDKIAAHQEEVEVDVTHDRDRFWSTPGPHYLRGTEITVTIPFSGDRNLFFISPNEWSSMPPHADVDQSSIALRRSGVNLQADQVRSEIDREIAAIKGKLSKLAILVGPYNDGLREIARQAIDARRNKLLKDQNLVAALGFPLKQRADAPQTYVAPEVRRKIKPTLPTAQRGPFQPEPALSTPDYEHILKVIEDMAVVMERSPSAFASIDEESLRSHFLVQLNGHYEGQATGETFNYEGKTDILIRVNGKNIFIGECKYWDGPKKLLETLDQLAAQTSWRDTKVAIIVFNRRKDFSAVLKSINETVPKHNSFKREVPIDGETKFRYVFGNRDDSTRELLLTVLAFDVPQPQIVSNAEG